MAGIYFKTLKRIHVKEKQAKIVLTGKWLLRSKHSSEGLKSQDVGQTSSRTFFHTISDYPVTKQLPLPLNIKELTSEILKFSPYRSRDISGSFISSATASEVKDINLDLEIQTDDRIQCYDCSGTINLSSVMQSNVPFPFVSRGKPVHLNMPGGQWGQKEKYVSEDLNNAHPTNTNHSHSYSGVGVLLGRKRGTRNSYMHFPVMDPLLSNGVSYIFSIGSNQFREYCTEKNKVDITPNLGEKNSTNISWLSNKEKLKAAIRDYGVVVIFFHVGISLVSLGCCYLIIASGIDLPDIFKTLGADEGAAAAGNAARFILAYAVHKTLAPGRIAITLTAVPFIVRKLRKTGLLKPPQPTKHG